MTDRTQVKLSQLFDLETIEQGLFRGQSWDLGFRALFGGQVLAQSLTAAAQTVEKDRACHSFHSYFLLPGDATKPVVYDVEHVRDGKSFSTRRIKAIQNGRNIFYMTASFQTPEEGVEHQYATYSNDLPKPDTLVPDIAKYEKNADSLPEKYKQALVYHKPIDIRTIPNADYSNGKNTPIRGIWLRANEAFGNNGILNQAALAYASDYNFLTTALIPHNLSYDDKSLALASIDHAMWFHRPFQFNEWLLYTIESPISGNARGFVKGQFFDQSGALVASTVQEGLIRTIK